MYQQSSTASKEMSSTAGEDGNRIVEGTKSFFESFVKQDFAAVEDFLSPDCRLQDQLGEGRGMNGIDKCMEKIREVAGKLAGAGLTKIEAVTVMRNQRQVRFMLHGKVGFMKISIGFAVEWSGGIVSLLVIVKNASDAEFLKDDTAAPPPPAPIPAAAAVSEHLEPATGQSADSPSAALLQESTAPPSGEGGAVAAPAEAQPSPAPSTAPPDTAAAAGRPKEDRWYPGKFIQQRRMSQNPTLHHAPNPYWATSKPGDYDVVMQSVGVTLHPPFLVPRPPAVPAALTVAVESASHLKSRLVRVVTRPVNSFVSVSVAGRSRNTPVVSRNSFPDYAASCTNGENIFIFELPNSVEFRRDGCVEFAIKDKNLRDEDVLAEIAVPIVSIKCKTDHSAPTRLQLPVELFSKHRPRLGKGFRKRRAESHDGIKSDEVSHLTVSISKVDIMLWWVLEEIRARDEAREKAIAEEKVRKAVEAERKLAEELHLNDVSLSNMKTEKKPKAVKNKKRESLKVTDVVFKEESEWVDGDACFGCGAKFSLTIWKHHCRACAQVFCDPCSNFQIADSSGASERVCKNCHKNYTVESPSHLTGLPTPEPTIAVAVARSVPPKSRVPDSDDEVDEERISLSSDQHLVNQQDSLRESAASVGSPSESVNEENGGDEGDEEDEDMACVIS